MGRLAGVAVFGLLVASVAAGAQEPVHRGNVQAGGQFARHECDGCHVVAANQDYPPLIGNYAPSFSDIANRPDTTAQSLRAFLAHPHAYNNMPHPDLTAPEVADVTAYILSLRGRH